MSRSRSTAVAAETLDLEGVAYLWGKIKAAFVGKNDETLGMNMCWAIKTNPPAINDVLQLQREHFIFKPTLSKMLFCIVSVDDKMYLTQGQLTSIESANYLVTITKVAEMGGDSVGSVSWNDILDKPELLEKAVFDAFKTSTETALSERPTATEVDSKIAASISSVYKYKGTVASFDLLPTENLANGDVYNVETDNMNYGWVEDETNENGGHWDPLGAIFQITPITNAQIDAIVNETNTGE